MMVETIYYGFKTIGKHIANHIKTAIKRASMTAAEPKSLARLERS